MMIKTCFQPYIALADMLTQTFGEDCEVVIHDLNIPEHSVVYVSNNRVTERQVGQSFDQLVKQVILSGEMQEDYVANYYFTASNGKHIRSSTLLIRSEDGRLAGALCINLDTTRITQQIAFLQSLLPTDPKQENHTAVIESEKPEHIADMINSLIHGIIGSKPPEEMTREERVEKVRFMEEKGIFLMKGSVEKAAEGLGVNRVTIYSYLDEIRGKRG